MSSQDSEVISLQRLGEDAAYTFKGLYKTSDWLDFQYKILLIFPIFLSIIVLCFDSSICSSALRILSVSSLMATLYLMFNQREYEKLKSYRLLANNFKDIYDKLEIDYYNNNFDNLMRIQERINGLRSETSDYPISFVGRYWSERVIQKEMDLSWVYKGRNQ